MGRLGNLRWAELALFGVLGSWAADEDNDAARLVLAPAARHAAWRAAQLADRLPREGHLEVNTVTQPAHPELEEVVAAFAGVSGSAQRLVVAFEVALPALAASVTGLASQLAPVADAPSLRILPVLVADIDRDCRTGGGVLAGVLDGGSGSSGTAGIDAGAIATEHRNVLDAAGGW
jgi:hypothetical protein